MSLFKPLRGNRASLDAIAKHDGYAYFCTDDGSFHIDYIDSDGNLKRKQINAKDAETLTGASLATILQDSTVEIPTSKAVLDALAGKSDVGHDHNEVYYTKTEIDTTFVAMTVEEIDEICGITIASAEGSGF